jgi:membrane protease YdiL (CAAX protease family)
MKDIRPSREEVAVQKHTIGQSIALHLLPGLLFLPVFVIAGRVTDRFGLPRHLAPFLIASTLVILPFELGYLLYQGKKLNGKLSLQGIILYREPMHWWQYIALALPLLLWAAFIFKVVGPPVDSFFIERFFSWMPETFFQSALLENLGQYSQASLLTTGILAIMLIGFVGPVVEELYFRGYLLPRMALRGGWAPTAHILLFSLYHFWSPWQNVVRILAMSPTYFAVWRNQNIYLGILCHVVLNVVSALGVTAVLLSVV